MSTGEAAWEPSFLSPDRQQTLTEYAELLLPRTETPGSRDVCVTRTIDGHLAAAAPAVQRRFVASLSWIDEESRAQFQASFLELSERDRLALLERASRSGDHDVCGHFMHLKMWIARAYYDSPAGMTELGWTGAMDHAECPGCPHPADGVHS